MTDDFVPLDEHIQKEFERQQELGELLAKAWKERDINIPQEKEYLDKWKQELSADLVWSYISAFRCQIEGLLLKGSLPEQLSEAFIYTIKDEPVRIEVLVVEGSDSDNYNLAGKDGFMKINEPLLQHSLRLYSQDPMGFLALPYIADSLRRGELEFSGLKLEYVTEENDVLRVTLDNENIF